MKPSLPLLALLVGALALVAAAQTPASYDTLLNQARAHAAEESWALARDAYTAAGELAPEGEGRRWCELWALDAALRAATPFNPENETSTKAHAALLVSYDEGAPRDDFWLALIEVRAEGLRRRTFWNRQSFAYWDDVLLAADELGRRPATPENATRYTKFLLHHLEEIFDSRPFMRTLVPHQRLLVHLRAAGESPVTVEEKVWLKLHVATLGARSGMSPAAVDETFAAAEALAPDTPAGAAALAAAFAWRAQAGRLKADADGFPDVRTWLGQLQSALEDLEGAPDNGLVRQARNDLEHLHTDWHSPRLTAAIPPIYRADETVAFGVGSAFVSRLRFSVIRLAPGTWPETFPPVPSSRSILPVDGETVAEWTANTDNAPLHAWQTRLEAAPTSLTPGVYAVTVQGDERAPIFRFFTVSSAAALAVHTPRGAEYLVYDNHTAEPLPGRSVTVRDASGHGVAPAATYSLVTDEHGRTVPAEKFSLPAERPHWIVVDGHPVWLPQRNEHYDSYGSRAAPFQLDLFTDRALFRPGETVRWKLIARAMDDGRFRLPEKPFTFDVILNDEPLIPQQMLTWSKLGTAHGSFVIPTDARPGQVSLELNRKPDNVDSGIPFSRPAGFGRGPAPDRSETGAHSVEFFTIDRFRPPPARATLDLAGEPTSLRPGGTATFRVRAEYFSGGPVTDAPVSFTLQAVTELFDDAKPHSLELRQWRDSLKTPRTTVTDARGVATVTVDIPPYAPDRLPFFVAASVQLHGEATISAHRLMALSPTGLHLEIERGNTRRHDYQGREWVLPGETVRYRYRLVDPFGRSVDEESEAILHERRWREIWLDAKGNPIANEELRLARLQHGSGPEALPALGWTRLIGEIVESTAASATPAPDSEGWRTIALTVPHAGVFQLRIHATAGEVQPTNHPNEGLYSVPISLIAADEETSSLALRPHEAFLLHRPPESPGQPPRFLAVFDEGVRHGLLAFSTPENVHTLQLPPPQRVRVVTPPATGERFESGSAYLVHPERGVYMETGFSTPTPRNRIETTLEKTSSVDQPGAVSEWRLTTRDADGRPAKAEVAVAVSDEAVNRLLSRPPPSAIFSVSAAVQRFAYHSSPLWKPASAVLETRDPRLGLRGYTTHVSPAPGKSIRSSVLVSGSLEISEERAGYASAITGNAGSSRHARTAAETALTEQGVPENSDELHSSKITIRRHFVSTAFWEPALETGEQGEARVSFTYPDNLTEWRLSAYSVGHDGQTFGTATALTPASLPFQARLQTPRYLIAGDAGTVAATLIDRTGQRPAARASLTLDGPAVQIDGHNSTDREVPFGDSDEARLRWPVRGEAPGESVVTLRAEAKTANDAMQLLLPVLEDGVPQRTSASAFLPRTRENARLRFTLPKPLDPQRTEVSVYLTPHRARAILDALPYLVDYPYGCVEQTVSRFLPAIIAQKTLTDLGVSAEDVERYVLRNERPADARRRNRTAGLHRLSDVVNDSIRRLEDLRNDHGLFGWWDHQSEADSWMSAYALLGLAMAKAEGYRINESDFKQTADALAATLAAGKQTSASDTFALAMLSLAAEVTADAGLRARFETLYTERDALGPAGRATLLLAASTFGTAEQRTILLRNLENGATRASGDGYGDTVHWGRPSGYWRAEDGAVESTALTLLALLEVAPDHPDIEAAVHWLVLNRRAGHWTNTRDTALTVLALSRSLAQTAIEASELSVDVLLNGKPLRNLTVDRAALLSPNLVLALDPAVLKAGENEIELRRVKGEGPLYATALASSWARGDSVEPAGHLAKVHRSFVRQASRPTLMGTLHVTPTPLADGEIAATGERVSARVQINLPHALNYVMIEVPKPAGCEPVNPLSGWDARLVKIDPARSPAEPAASSHNGQRVYREEHDEKSVFFLHHVPAGDWELRFELQALHPGDYRALPVHFEAMYAPEVRANSDARRLKIDEVATGKTPGGS